MKQHLSGATRALAHTLARTGAAALLLAGCLGAAGATNLQQVAPQARALQGASTAQVLAQNSTPEVARSLADLRAKASQSGALKVLVTVRAAFAPEGGLSRALVQQQRSEIAAAQAAVQARLPRAASAGLHRYQSIPYLALTVDAQQLEALAQMPEVTDIQEDRLSKPSLAESSPLIGANLAWGAGFSGSGWAVAVLDTGVQKSHPFLAGKVSDEACFSTNYSAYSASSLCPGGVSQSTAPDSGLHCTVNGCDHGTHVAGIAAGSSSSFSGVAKGANIVAVQVFSRFDSTAQCGSTVPCVLSFTSDQIKALDYLYTLSATRQIAAVNMSLGGGSYSDQASCDAANTAIQNSMANLRSVKIATVVAAGNDSYTSSLSAPGCVSSAVSVGSTWDAAGWTCSASPSAVDKVACYSNTANYLDLLAPGSAIQSSVPTSSYAVLHGTSMAAPQVAGCWAVLRSAVPTASADQIETALKATGKPVSDYRVSSIVKPRIECKAALDYLQNAGTSTAAVSVSKQGAGSGTVVSTPAGISCGSACTADFSTGTTVALQATAAPGSVFAGWTGACTGTAACSLLVTAPQAVTASFNLLSYNLGVSVSKAGNGTVRSADGKISCSGTSTGTCSASYTAGSSVSLTAQPAGGRKFVGWSGACTGTSSTCVVSMTASKSVKASFR